MTGYSNKKERFVPKVSICLLTYNRAHLLPRSLDSLLAQTYQDFELIISDNCSPDETEKICREYAKRDARVRYYRNSRNLGMVGNYNVALSRARGEYVAIVHDGDIYRRDLIEKWVNALDTYPSAAFVFNALEAVDYFGRHKRFYYHPYPPFMEGLRLLDEMLTRWDSPVFGMVMLRKSCYEAVGPFDESLGFVGDVDMWMRLLLKFDVAYIREPLIQIIPREPGHPLSRVNWEHLQNLEQLHRLNIQRRYAQDPKALRLALRRLRRRRDRFWLWNLLLCLKNRDGRAFREGLSCLRGSSSLLLRVAGVVAQPFALLMSDQ